MFGRCLAQTVVTNIEFEEVAVVGIKDPRPVVAGRSACDTTVRLIPFAYFRDCMLKLFMADNAGKCAEG